MSNTSRTSERAKGGDSRNTAVAVMGLVAGVTIAAVAVSNLLGACNPETPAPASPPRTPASPEQSGHAAGVIDGAPLVVSAESFNASPSSVAAAGHLAVGHA